MTQAVDMKQWQPRFVELGVWVRPFGKLVYLMPPFVINREDLDYLIRMVVRVVSEMKG
jgi:adenosylmethionine-8-amino-7-oxononanoate aminotransferase